MCYIHYIYNCVFIRISSLCPFHLPYPVTYIHIHTVIIKLRACILYDRARVRRRKKNKRDIPYYIEMCTLISWCVSKSVSIKGSVPFWCQIIQLSVLVYIQSRGITFFFFRYQFGVARLSWPHIFREDTCTLIRVKREKKSSNKIVPLKWHQNTAFAIPNLESATRYEQAHEWNILYVTASVYTFCIFHFVYVRIHTYTYDICVYIDV